MIIGSFKPMEIGKIYDGGYLTDERGNAHEIPHLVMRQASLDEWIAEFRSNYGEPSPAVLARAMKPDCYFYEVSVD